MLTAAVPGRQLPAAGEGRQVQLRKLVSLLRALVDTAAARTMSAPATGSHSASNSSDRWWGHHRVATACRAVTRPSQQPSQQRQWLLCCGGFLRHSGSSSTPEQQQLQPEVPLNVYCCNPACCRWPWRQFAPSPAAAEALLDEVFPAELLLAHACTVVKLLR